MIFSGWVVLFEYYNRLSYFGSEAEQKLLSERISVFGENI